jgi:hypothetical protein
MRRVRTQLPLLPVPAGMDNVHGASYEAFNVRKETAWSYLPPAVLKAVRDMNVQSDGKLVTRQGAEEILFLSAGRRIFGRGSSLYTLAGPTLSRIAGTTPVSLVTGLDEGAEAFLLNWPAGSEQLLFSCGAAKHIISSTTVRPWGLPVPALTYEEITGTVPAGRYLCAATFRDGLVTAVTAQESGAIAPTQIELTKPGGIRLSVLTTLSGPTHVSFYMTAVDQAEPFRLITVPLVVTEAGLLGSVDVTADVRGSLTEMPLLTQGWGPPPAGISALGALQAFVLAASGSTLYRSWPSRPGLFQPAKALQVFPAPIRTIVGLADGAYVGTDAGLFWLAGAEPEAWRRRLVAPIRVLPDGAAIPGSAIPSIETAERVAIFASGRGLLVGMPNGEVKYLTQNRYHFPSGRASIALRGNQLFISVV